MGPETKGEDRMPEYNSQDDALGALMAASGVQDWDTCQAALEYLVVDQLGADSLESYTPKTEEEALDIWYLLTEAELDAAPDGTPPRQLYMCVDTYLKEADSMANVNEAFDEIFSA